MLRPTRTARWNGRASLAGRVGFDQLTEPNDLRARVLALINEHSPQIT
ncbi:MAG: hypothetical protein M3401_06900 [Actinomycetota bacterium]|nr:hypothetical protein [Actinomycetota bacterium]